MRTSPVLCLGCGEVSPRSSDRRNLMSNSSQHVVPLWKKTIASELQKRNQLIDLDGLISGWGEPHRAGQMCRKCFYAYEKVLNASAVIEASAVKALDAMTPATSSLPRAMKPCTKRASSNPGITTSTPKKRPPAPFFSPDFDDTEGRKRSPDVAVRILQSVHIQTYIQRYIYRETHTVCMYVYIYANIHFSS